MKKLISFIWKSKLLVFSSLYIVLFLLIGFLGYFLQEPEISRIECEKLISPSLKRFVMITKDDGFTWERMDSSYQPEADEKLMRKPNDDVLFIGPHILGTDKDGRDMMVRIIVATKAYLFPSFLAVLISMIFGIPLGIVGSDMWNNQLIKTLPQGFMDMLESMPKYITILLAIILIPIEIRNIQLGIFQWQQFYWLSMLLGVLNIPKIGRLIVQKVNALEKREFIESAMAMGLGKFRVAVKHVLRHNCGPLFITEASLLVTEVIFIETTLAYLGSSSKVWGIEVTKGWGYIIMTAKEYLHTGYGWWITFFPIIAIVMTVLMINIFSHNLTKLLTQERTSTEF